MDSGDLFRNRPDRGVNHAATLPRLRTDDPQVRVVELERQVDALQLACRAMWELMAPKAGLHPDELERRINEIDLRDGHLDGRMTPAPVECGSCGKRVGGHRATCYYCGDVLPKPAR